MDVKTPLCPQPKPTSVWARAEVMLSVGVEREEGLHIHLVELAEEVQHGVLDVGVGT